MQDLRKRLDIERSQKEEFARALNAVKEEVTAAQVSSEAEAKLAQQQVSLLATNLTAALSHFIYCIDVAT